MSDPTEDSGRVSSSLEHPSGQDPDGPDALLRTFSHDVATPLANIKLAADVVAMAGGRIAEEKLAELGRNMSSEADRLSQMIDTLIEWTRFEVGERQLRWQWHLAEDLISSALRSMKAFLDDHDVVVTIVPDLAYVRGDETLIEIALTHLVDNAVARTPSGEQIEIVARADGTGCSFEVIDTGPRLDAEEDIVVDAPLDAASCDAHSGRAGPFGGRLGLSLSRKIVEAHDGEIWARNRNNESGAVFAFVLGYSEETPPRAPIEASFSDDGTD